MQLKNNKIILRDMQESDIDDIIYWNTIETEWMLWDAPWEHENAVNFDIEKYRIDKTKQIQQLQKTDVLRSRLEICINNDEQTHIGCVSSYFINEDYQIDEDGKKIAIGICIYALKYRKNGYGSNAFQLYIDYLKDHRYTEIYTQTWSGNIPLIKMVEKLDFKECNRYQKIRQVRGELYDGLTFCLK